jgi:hypothetical protein
MSDNDARSQSTTGNTTSGTIETNAAAGTAESSSSHELSIGNRLAACEGLVDDAVEKGLPAAVLADSLKDLGLKAVEAVDYLEEFNQRVAIRHSKAKQSESQQQDSPRESPRATHDQEGRDRAVDEAAWASLLSKLESSAAAQSLGLSSNVLDKVFELFGQEVSPSATLSKSVMDVAPHLADDEDTVFEDPHLRATQKCKMAYSSQKPFENLIIKGQGRKMREPVANSIWRLVILDKYVDFEKLYATLEPGYNPNDEAKELGDNFTLVEKNSVSSKRPVLTEAEWMRLYDIWVDAVLHFYPHRRVELASYRELVINMFRATVSPFPAIKYDRDSRERYSRQSCHLDSSKDVLPFPLLSQLLSHASPPSSSSRGSKRKSADDEAPKKRSETVCRNWNKGSCEGDSCRFGRRHNECCECGGHHRAKDRSECKAAFNSRQQPRSTAARGGRT